MWNDVLGGLGGLGNQMGHPQGGLGLQEQQMNVLRAQIVREQANYDIWRGDSTPTTACPRKYDGPKTAREELQAEVDEWLPDL